MANTNELTVISPKFALLLNKAKFTKNTNIPNNHGICKAEVERWGNICSQLGIDFNKTTYTVAAVKKTVDGVDQINHYAPYVGSYGGVPAVAWGEVRLPLVDTKSPYELVETEGRFSLEFTEGNVWFSLPIVTAKGVSVSKLELKKALKSGQAGDFLSPILDKPKSLSDLAPGEYSVVGYKSNNYKGESGKFIVEIQGKGWFKGNTTINSRLAMEPVINSSTPADLTVYKSTRTTATGYPIVPVDFTPAEDKELPEFIFGDEPTTAALPQTDEPLEVYSF